MDFGSRKKLFLIYNPRSSHFAAVEREVLVSARNLPGWVVAKYEIKPTNFTDNVRKISMLVADDMLVVTAGGDGTAAMVANAILKSGKKATLAVLGYGNLNDFADMLDANVRHAGSLAQVLQAYEAKSIAKLHPLEILVNGEHWRYAPCYVSLGLLAEATTLMEDHAVREKLRTGKKGKLFSLRMAMRWYRKHHKAQFLPAMTLNGEELPITTTDYLAVNSPTAAGIMKSYDWWREPKEFGSTARSLGKYRAMVKFGWRSVRKGLSLDVTERDILEFAEPSSLMAQTEGEYARLEKVERIEVHKANRILHVVAFPKS